MSSTAVIGLQWGDEGKGKVIDGLAADADVVARYAGGNNAGHTVIVGDEKYVLHLIPGGILHEGKVNLIGRGVVVNLAALLEEVDGLVARGVPVMAHIPLIHGPDGAKLSKRHGALGVEAYREMGYLPSAMRNYLVRLGWSHGDDEFFTDAQAQAWFDLDGIGKSPARFDFKKLENLCGQHIAASDDAALLHELQAFLAATDQPALSDARSDLMGKAMYCLKERAKTFPELLEKAQFVLADRPIRPDEKGAAQLDDVSRGILKELTPHLQNASWTRDALEAVANEFAESKNTKFGKLAGPLRAALAGRSATPSVFDMMLVLGREETLARLTDAAG